MDIVQDISNLGARTRSALVREEYLFEDRLAKAEAEEKMKRRGIGLT